SAVTATAGLGLGLWGALTIDPLVATGGLMSSDPLMVPNLAPLIAIIAAVVLEIVALLVPMLRTRTRPARVADAAANKTPLIVSQEADEVTFVWGEPKGGSNAVNSRRALAA
ncbi:MAG: hypothetical protein ACTH31_13005, partial [Pseudoclavibacter sp.]